MSNGFKFNPIQQLWTIEKTPVGALDYGHNWAQWLAEAEGDTLATSSWAVSSSDLTIVTSSIQGAKTVVWLSGGALGVKYKVTNSITTVGGRTTTRTFVVSVVPTLSG